MPTIGERIRHRRSALSLTQTDLAECVGYKKAAVSTWERGTATPPLNVIEEIAKALHTTSEYLLGYTDRPEDWECQAQEAAKGGGESPPPSAEPVLTSDERDLINAYRALNEPGKDAVLAGVQGIASNPKFRRNVAESVVGSAETQAV